MGTSQDQVDGGTGDDEQDSRHTGDQPPAPAAAAITIMAAADHVEDRLVGHKANVQSAPRDDEYGPGSSSELTTSTSATTDG